MVPTSARSTPKQRAACPVVLVSMPFMDVRRPSIQLGLLKAVGQAHGFPVRTLHANLDLAVRIGADLYERLAERQAQLVGDWLFSVEAFGAKAPDPDGRLLGDFHDKLGQLGASADHLLHTRKNEIPAYLDALVEDERWDDVRVVGFSSTFQQNAASFALARRLKERYPHLVTVFGGANFDGEMGVELMRAMDCVDLAVIGEGDVAFPRLLDAIAAGSDPGDIPGVARRVGGEVVVTMPAPPHQKLDDLPTPDYDEYFQRAEELGLLARVGHREVWIPFESARGCWWGAKHHCTFCGLNGSTMTFRSKSPQRVLDEVARQARRYRSFRFEAVDNILDVRYLKELFPRLVDERSDYEFFYEVKANLTREQLKLMAAAGVLHVQPGIESLDSRVLTLMRKGVRAAQNINLLRWARYYGIDVTWNILWGFPGEAAEDYVRQAATAPHLVHLQPPSHVGRIWLERFSPMQVTPEVFGLRRLRAGRSYRYVYPDTVDLDRIAYFFEYEQDDALPDSTYDGLSRAVDGWKAAWEATPTPALTYWSAPDFLQIHDARRPGAEGTYTFHGDLANIYLACSERPMSAQAVRAETGTGLPVEAIEEAFGEFQRRGLMFLDGSLALALALPAVGGR